MKMFVSLVLFAAFALPAAFATEQDVITLQAYEQLLKNGGARKEMTKVVISSPVLEETLVSYSENRLGGLSVCGETCVGGTWNTPVCSCNWPVCTRNSHETTKSASPPLEEALAAFSKKRNSLESTKSVNPLLEEALVVYTSRKGNLGGEPCSKSCVTGICIYGGCICDWPVCKKNSLIMSCKTEI